ncbi:MAG TPA: bifunctional UDP-sugar hydrolase/5'-nucleotidase [Longimicrobium sp.]
MPIKPRRMRTTPPLRGLVLATLLAGACAPVPLPPVAAPAPAAKRLRVVHTNDFHGRLLPQTPSWAAGRPVGGAAVLAAHFDSARARFAGATLVLSAGDVMQGTAISNLSWGRSSIDVHNASRYDAAALGNHEFDWGQDTLRARIRDSRFPWLAANLHVAGTDRHPEWVRPWTMVERAGVRVGVIGIALPNTPEVVVPGRVAGLDFRPEAPAIDRYAREARAAGADFVVVTMHVGASCAEAGRTEEAESTGCRGEMLEVARAVTEPIDLMVGGHTHLRVLTTENGIPLVEAASYSTAYSVTDLERSGGTTRVTARAVRVPYADQVTPDTMVARLVRDWEARVRPITQRVVATVATELPRGPGEYALGNLLADAFRRATGAQASLVNNGSIRRDIPAGALDYGVLYELQPFQNALSRVEVTGAQLRAALENAVAGGSPAAHLAGLTVEYSPTRPAGQRIRSIRLDDGRVVGDTDRVTLGLTEFVAGGGDRYTSLAGGRATSTGQVDLDALIDYLRAQPQPVRAPAVGRWRRVD